MHSLFKRKTFKAFVLVFLVFIILDCSSPQFIEQKRLLLGTEVSIKIFSHLDPEASSAIQAAFNEIKRVEGLASFFNKDSELFRLNEKAAQGPVEVSEELFSLLEKGHEMSELTGGAFDITATSLGVLGGHKKIVLNEEKREVYFKDKDCKIDLGAYAKGYAVDKAIEILKKHPIKNALVDAGGDIRTIGSPAASKNWSIGIRDPERPRNIFKTITLNKETAVATSGNYLRNHIISLKPREASVLSVTVIAPTAMEADMLSTALFDMEENERLKLIRDFDNIEVLLIEKKEDGSLVIVKCLM